MPTRMNCLDFLKLAFPNLPNGSPAIFRVHLNTICHCTIYQDRDTGYNYSWPERGKQSGPRMSIYSPPIKVLTASKWPCDLDPQRVLISSILNIHSYILLEALGSVAQNKGDPGHLCDEATIKMSKCVKPVLSWVQFMCWFPWGQFPVGWVGWVYIYRNEGWCQTCAQENLVSNIHLYFLALAFGDASFQRLAPFSCRRSPVGSNPCRMDHKADPTLLGHKSNMTPAWPIRVAPFSGHSGQEGNVTTAGPIKVFSESWYVNQRESLRAWRCQCPPFLQAEPPEDGPHRGKGWEAPVASCGQDGWVSS